MIEPRRTIVFQRVIVDGDQQKRLAELFGSPGLALLKEIISAHAAEHQIKALNAGLYYDNTERAQFDMTAGIRKAGEYNHALDVLDDLSAKQEEWFTAKLEHRP